MSVVNRVRVVLSGSAVVGSGVSTFYFTPDSTGMLSALRAFYSAIVLNLPDKLTLSFPNAGDQIESTTGELAGTWSEASVANLNGSDTGNFVLGTGARVRWLTEGVVGGRRVRGTTFLVPLTVNAFNEDDALNNAFVTAAQAAADALWSDPDLTMEIVSPPSGLRPGDNSTVIGAIVPDAVSWLRSRRT